MRDLADAAKVPRRDNALRHAYISHRLAEIHNEHQVAQKPMAKCREYAANPRGFLLMRGTVGSGKTYLAVAIARALLRRKHPLFITHADFL